jgi:molecular chaperone DnaJ
MKVEPHPIFERKNNDIQHTQEISFVNACLGISIMVPTLGGEEEELTIPPGTQFGQLFRIKGKGLPAVNRSPHIRGDQLVGIHINVPNGLTSEEENLLKQFDEKTKEHV